MTYWWWAAGLALTGLAGLWLAGATVRHRRRPTRPDHRPPPDLTSPARGTARLHHPDRPATYPDAMTTPAGRIFRARTPAEADHYRACCSAVPLHPHRWPHDRNRT